MTTISSDLTAADEDDPRRTQARVAGRAILLLPVEAVAVGALGGLVTLLPLLVPPLAAGLPPAIQVPSTVSAAFAAAIVGIGYSLLAGIGSVLGALAGRALIRRRPVGGAAAGAGLGALAGAALVVSGAVDGPSPLLWALAVIAAALAAGFVVAASRAIHARNPF
ncbi:hypothetical protein CLV49_0859 [Labedella gwakjiensis]|uniref:Uncharacterized protein n=1 Tax=Labedella gwakjiensis TaxID=390269 RepID=A0A2P8GTI3_9MICO|nr:hypothetical protein [Labedella gwakjiensis]PSL37252.1 hypothetical protein CLV49_0859 [Labedella gwakjiensis]RUQ84582.1 hypothetical protein ELQ93_13315 [Labedella gwakjiensis]